MIAYFLGEPAYAHAGEAHATPAFLWQWNHDWFLFSVLCLFSLVYGLGIGHWRKRMASETPFPTAKAFCFFLGFASFYAAVTSPLDAMGEIYLFSAHMVQHNILIFISPILILWGIPEWFAQAVLDNRWVQSWFRVLVHPMFTLVAFNLIFGLWHVPALYELALRDQVVHDLEHLTFFLTALMMWHPIMAPIRAWRISYALQMLYLLGLSIGQIPIFAYVTFADTVHYPTYLAAERMTGWLDMSPLADQKLGGAIMKISSMVVFGGILLHAFLAWYRQENEPTPDQSVDLELVSRSETRYG